MAKSEKMVSVNSERLKFAREHYGLSLDEVADKLNIKRELLEKFEATKRNDSDFPSYAQLEKLSELYDRPLLFFFFSTTPPNDELAVAFRSIEKNIGGKLSIQIRKMIEKANLYRLNLSELYTQQNVPIFEELLSADSVTNANLASWLRKKLNLSLEKQKGFARADSFLEYLREQLYNIGIYVFKDSFREDSVSGLCLYDNKYPVILLNNKTTFNRQVFTIFHEIYHLFNKEMDVYMDKRGEEKACDKFAGEFLIPKNNFDAKLKNVSRYEDMGLIERLADDYTVSAVAIAYRLLSEGHISIDFYLNIQEDRIRRMNNDTAGGNFYFTRISYLGKPYLKHVFNDYYAGRISAVTVGKYTGLKTVHVSRLSSNMLGGEF